MDQKADDKIAQFNELVKGLTRKGLYCDEEFPANETSLGELECNPSLGGWRRP